MKMQSNLSAPIAGRITRVLVTANERVEAKDLLLTISPV
jgi:biotin carboxyl carrier protein